MIESQSARSQSLGKRISALESLLAILGSSASTSTETTFIFRPGGTAGGNVFTTWAAVVAACKAQQGPRWIEIDTSLGAAVVSGGTLSNANDVTIQGYGATGTQSTRTDVSITGALVGVAAYEDLAITYSGAATCNALTAAHPLVRIRNCSVLVTGAGDFAQSAVAAALVPSLFFEESSSASTPTGAGVVGRATGAGTFLLVTFESDSSASPNAFEQTAGGTTTLAVDATCARVSRVQNAITAAPTPNNWPATVLTVDATVTNATNAGNLYATMAQAAAAAKLIPGPKTIEVRGNTFAWPFGTYDFGNDPITLRGQSLDSFAATYTAITFAAGVIISPTCNIDFEDLQLTNAGASPVITTAQFPAIFKFRNATLRSSGGGAIITATGGAFLIAWLMESTVTSGGAKVLEATGGGTFFQLTTEDDTVIGINTLASSGGGTLYINSVGAANSITFPQAGIPTGTLTIGNTLNLFSNATNVLYSGTKTVKTCLDALVNVAQTDGSSTVAPTPANQTAPAANTVVAAAVVTPASSGRFLVAIALDYTGVAANNVKTQLRSRTKVAAIAYGNATATGTNSFVATADGTMTLAGTTDATLDTTTIGVLAAQLSVRAPYTALVVPNATNAIAVGKNVAFEVTVESAANVTGLKATISVVELP